MTAPRGMQKRLLRQFAAWCALCAGVSRSAFGLGQVYDENESRMFASLSSVSYCESMDKVYSWTCTACSESKTRLVPGKIRVVDAGTKNATRIIIGKLRDQSGCLMAFRGSNNVENWVRDFQFWEIDPSSFDGCDGCKVHHGFYDIWKNVREPALTALKDVGCKPDENDADNLLYVTGHSLGAALTQLAMFALDDAGFNIAKTYSFEAPRIGNKAFSEAFSSRFLRKFPVFRITHYMDPVPHLPPEALGYIHVQKEVYYNRTGSYKICENVEDRSCADKHWDILNLVAFHSGDHCSSPLVPNGDICNPVGCEPSMTTVV